MASKRKKYSRLTQLQKQKLQADYLEGTLSTARLAFKYNVSTSTVGRIVSGLKKGSKYLVKSEAIRDEMLKKIDQAEEATKAVGPAQLTAEDAQHMEDLDTLGTDWGNTTISLVDSDFQTGVLVTAKRLLKKGETAGVRSAEGAATAAVKLLETYQKLFPETMEDIVIWTLSRGNFNPQKFLQILSRAYAVHGWSMYPMDMDSAIDFLFTLPSFDPIKYAEAIAARYAQQNILNSPEPQLPEAPTLEASTEVNPGSEPGQQ